ncbi:MAG: hypothetical protein P1U54_08860 [Immundisolibacteraceae bacterium]|nr:hypothetical protein [Immundisolibacteraceae bacterium]
MNEPNNTQTQSPADLLTRWYAISDENPGLRARDAAAQLGVTEAELVAARCGDRVIRLTGPWSDLIKTLPDLGTVMALTRNNHAVHEKTGSFDNIQLFPPMGLVLNQEIDLRIFLNHWHIGFAVTEATEQGDRHSLQFFDADGTAIHKLYLRDPTKQQSFDQLVKTFAHTDQTPGLTISASTPPAQELADDDIDQEGLRRGWAALEDVHDFHQLLTKHGAGRVQALRLVGEEFAQPVVLDAFQTTLTQAAETTLPIMIFVGNPGVIQIHTGPVYHLKRVGGWFNVLDDGFNLHLVEESIASAWVVRKPSRDGTVTSLEIYDHDNQQIALMFGERKPGEAEREDWRQLLSTVNLTGASVT